ncbi:tetratricopeptide repeat protein [Streptomyces sp. CA-251387]|uniref:tetratricopeptide repeat protein n=1 Tax=Streptomyces sp. CA-251387 TaxID=3240064 RepID=UPI003D90A374
MHDGSWCTAWQRTHQARASEAADEGLRFRFSVSAVALLEDTVTVRQRLLGRTHPATLTGQVNLVLERSLAGYRATFGPRHPYTISVDNRLRSWREQHTWRWWRRTRGPAGPAGVGGDVTR